MDCVEMGLQVGCGDEPVLALAALVRPLPTVGHLVLGQVTQLLESLSTHFTRSKTLVTFIWVLPCVNSLVCHQIALLVKSLLAIFTLVLCRLFLLSYRDHFLNDLMDKVVDISGHDDIFRFWSC